MKFLTPILYSFIYISIIAVNYLANALPLNGMNTGELSDKYDSMITPAGTAFSIWGLIYILLLIFVIKVWIGFVKKDQSVMNESRMILPFFVWNGFFNIGWLFAWHYEYVNLSLFIMAGILLSLIFIYRKRNIVEAMSMIPFSVYLGWISVATIVNTSVVILHNSWTDSMGSPVIWTIIMILVALFLGIYVVWTQADGWYGLVIAWASLFISLENELTPAIYYTAFVSALIIAALSIYYIFAGLSKKPLLSQ